MFPPEAEIEMGAVRPDELESLLGLICEVFQLPYEPAREIFYSDPYLDLENKRVLRVDGRIVSCLSIADREVWLNSKTVRVGGIAGVATHPDERGKGYASRLLADTLDYLKAQGYAFSALVPYSSHFYRRLGYELCGNACRYVTSPSFLPTSHEVRNVRPARSDDAEALAFVYSAQAYRSVFWGVRDVKRWQYLLKNVERCDAYVEPDGAISGYLLSDLRQTPPAFEGDIPLPTLRILELIAQNPKALRGLIAHAAAQQNAGMLELCASAQQLIDYGLLNLIGTGIGEEILANIEVVPMLMARILDFRTVLEANFSHTQPYVNPESWQDLRVQLRDPSSSAASESWIVHREPTGFSIRIPHKEDSSLPFLSGTMHVWTQVLTGFRSADDAIAQDLLHTSEGVISGMHTELFPSRLPFLPTPDHF